MWASVDIDDQLKGRIEKLAEAQRRSPEHIMREAIRTYVDRAEKRQCFRQEALEAWATYQESGRHLTGQETRDLLGRWGTDQETELPQCHE